MLHEAYTIKGQENRVILLMTIQLPLETWPMKKSDYSEFHLQVQMDIYSS
jgi:hypothetical protein